MRTMDGQPTLKEYCGTEGGHLVLLSQFGITTVAELMLFTSDMVDQHFGRSFLIDIAHKIDKFEGATLRDRDEPVVTTLKRRYGEVLNAPLEVLNFTVLYGAESEFKPLSSIMRLRASTIEDLSVRDFKRVVDSGPLEFEENSELYEFHERLVEWLLVDA